MRQRAVLERVDVRLDRVHLDAALRRALGEQRGVVDALRAGDDLLTADEDVVGIGVVRVGRVGHGVKRPRRRRVLGEHVKVGVVLFLDELPEDALVLGAEVPERVHALDASLSKHRDPLRKLESERRAKVLEGLVRELLGHDLELVLKPLVQAVEHVQEQVVQNVEHLEVVLLDGHLHVQSRELAQVAVGV